MTFTKHANGLLTWPTLYKTSSKGKEQEWALTVIPVANLDSPVTIRVQHGQVGGKIQTSSVHVHQGKNLGKANETTPLQQATLEAQAKWLKQKDKGYSEERGGGSMALKPMLAHKYEDVKNIAFPSYVQPKLDGVRAIAYRVGNSITLFSRQGKEHKGLAHVRRALLTVMKEREAWDGELYVHGMGFQKLISLVKKDQPESAQVEYHVYDAVTDRPFEKRRPWVPDGLPVKMVLTAPVFGREDVESYHAKFVELGYEGAILRVGECAYTQGYRSRQLLKVKAFQEDDFLIVDVVPGVGKMAKQGIFLCQTEGGAQFGVKPKGRDELREEYLLNKQKYVGKMLTVVYFNLTEGDSPVPRFPVGKGVRDYE